MSRIRMIVVGVAMATVTLAVGALAVILADFGAPPWVFVPIWVWLLTAGLPATAAVVLVAAIWGMAPGLYGLGGFMASAAAAAAVVQTATVWLVVRPRQGRP